MVSSRRNNTVYTRILVPLDGSKVAEAALEHAVQMAALFDAELILLRAAFLDQVPNLDMSEAQRILVQESEVYLHEVAAKLQGRARCVRTAVCWSQAAEAIVDYAVSQAVSVVVMATHGQSGPERWPLGSVAENVLRRMQIPILLIRPAPCLDEETVTGHSVQ
jgi:nucleotide-binding universal stress UspA family protein